MSLKASIMDDVKTAMKARDKDKVAAIRMLTAAIKQQEVDQRIELDDDAVIAIVGKLIKQRKDAAQQFKDAGRSDLEDKELFELSVLQAYLPAQLSSQEIEQIVRTAVAESGASGIADMGQVMAAVRPKLAGRADMGAVSQTVKSILSS